MIWELDLNVAVGMKRIFKYYYDIGVWPTHRQYCILGSGRSGIARRGEGGIDFRNNLHTPQMAFICSRVVRGHAPLEHVEI